MADKFQLKALITGVDRLSPMLSGIGKNANSLRKQLESSGLGKISFGDVLQGGAMAAPFVMGVKAAIGFESKMADVRKVVDFDSPEQFKQMGKDVLDLGTKMPMLAGGIAEIMAAAGQANIPRQELLGFSKDAIKMSIAFDQTAEESGKTMATWRTAFKLSQDGVVELADKINYLGNTGPASNKQITAIVTRLGALGEVAGLGTGHIAALGATLAGVGVQEEIAATGMKNFMLTLNSASGGSKARQQMFKALRLDGKQLQVDMQKDAQGTMLKVLTAISKVDKSKQASVLEELVGRESIAAIAPMLTNLDLLKSNFEKVGDATAYAGSMQKEYDTRAATTENALKLLQGKALKLGVTVGDILLPPFNNLLETIGPVIEGVADLAGQNPWLIKTVLGAALGFTALRLAVMGGTMALKLMSSVVGMSPIGLLVRGIALGAGILIANWGTVGPFFKSVWDFVAPLFEAGWELLKTVFAWSPLGLVMSNWEPIVAWFKQMWERIQPFLQPIIKAAEWMRGKAQTFVTERRADRLLGGNLADMQQSLSALPPATASPLQARQSPLATMAAAQKQQLQGEMVVRFENAPPGLKMESATSSQPGVQMFSQVGRRSLSGG